MQKPTSMLSHLKAATHQNHSPQNQITLCRDIGLMRGRIHEVQGVSADGFAAAIIAKAGGSSLWAGRRRDIHSLSPTALLRYFDVSKLTLTECLTRKEILWAADQALRSKGFETVILQLHQGPNFNESRRLQIAAEAGRSTGLVIIKGHAQSSAAQSRWQCTPLKTTAITAANDHIWQWNCTKNKSGTLGTWQVRWKENGYAAGDVDMVS